MKDSYSYPIGEPGKKWTDVERTAWRESHTIKREYQQEVVPKIKALAERFDIEQYGALSYDEDRFPLFAIKTKAWDENKPTV
ncbi:peptidase, partial [Vibrio fortis]